MWNPQRPGTRLPALPDATARRTTAADVQETGSSTSQKPSFPDLDPDIVLSTRRRPIDSSAGSDVSASRLLQIEGRLAATERGNRALLEELVRWQSDLKASARRQDDIWREERREVLQLVENTRANNDSLAQLHQRMKGVEESNFSLRQALGAHREHVQRIEQKFVEHSHAQSTRLDQLTFRFDRWEHDHRHAADRANRMHDEIERKTAAIGEDLRQVKSRQEMTGIETQTMFAELRTSTKRLDTEQQGMLAGAAQLQSQLNRLQGTMEKLAPALGQSISDLKTGLADLERRTSFNEQEQSNQLVALRQSLTQLEASHQSALQQNSQHFTENQHAIDELTHRLAEDHTRFNSQLQSLGEKYHSDLQAIQKKTREEVENYILDLQKALEKEHAAGESLAAECRQDITARATLVEKSVAEQLEEVKGWIKSQRSHLEHGFQQVSESVRLAEQQAQRSHQELEKVLHAEIQSRRRDNERQSHASQHVGQRLEAAVMAVQQTQASLSAQITDGAERARLEWKKELAEHSERFDRSSADVETRLSVFATRLSHIESSNQLRVDELARSHDLALQQHLVSLEKWRQGLGSQVQELRVQLESVPLQISDMGDRLAGIKADVIAKVETERQSRLQDTASCRRELASRIPPGSLEQQQAEYNRKLSEMENRVAQALSQLMEFETVMQTSRTTLNSRIASEANARLESLIELRQDLSRLSGQVEFLLQQNEHRQLHNEPFSSSLAGQEIASDPPRTGSLLREVSARPSAPLEHRQIFFVPIPGDFNANDLPYVTLNQWGLWQAWRWLVIKKRWQYLLERAGQPRTNVDQQQEEEVGDSRTLQEDSPVSEGDNQHNEDLPFAEDNGEQQEDLPLSENTGQGERQPTVGANDENFTQSPVAGTPEPLPFDGITEANHQES